MNFESQFQSFKFITTGLPNLGNTCYMNSVLQCLLQLRSFQKIFLGGYQIDENSMMVQGIRELLISPNKNTQHNLIMLIKGFINRYTYYEPFQQQDSHEFLMLLLDAISQQSQFDTIIQIESKSYEITDFIEQSSVSWELSRSKDNSPITEMFYGQLVTIIQCVACNHDSYSFEDFGVLSLPISKNLLVNTNSCLKEFIQKEELDNEYKCDSCGKLGTSVKNTAISKFPDVLIIQFKRFQNNGTKDSSHVKIMKQLKFSSIISNQGKKSYIDQEYVLQSIVHHYGTLDSGHYTAQVYQQSIKDWINCNDQQIHILDYPDLETQSGYISFYQKK